MHEKLWCRFTEHASCSMVLEMFLLSMQPPEGDVLMINAFVKNLNQSGKKTKIDIVFRLLPPTFGIFSNTLK